MLTAAAVNNDVETPKCLVDRYSRSVFDDIPEWFRVYIVESVQFGSDTYPVYQYLLQILNVPDNWGRH